MFQIGFLDGDILKHDDWVSSSMLCHEECTSRVSG